MLFIVIHEHTPERCPANDPAPLHRLADEGHAKESGVKVVGSYNAAPEHTLFFVLEADDYAQVVRYLRPVTGIGKPRIVPVQTLADSLATLATH